MPGRAGGNRQALLKYAIELTPVAVWFIVFRMLGIIPATAVLIMATLLSLVAAKVFLGKISPALILTATIVTVFGGLTVALQDARFIKVKPTFVNLLFAGGLTYGLVTGKNLLQLMFGEAFTLTPAGWRLLTIRWIGLFVVLAALNEIIWRRYNTPETEYIWAYYKFLGMPLLSVAYTILNMPLIMRHTNKASDAVAADGDVRSRQAD